MDDNRDHVWLTYDEAAKALGIKADSVRRRAALRKWPKRLGNDNLARVGIPREIIPDRIHDATPAVTHENPENSDVAKTREDLAAAQTEIRVLRELLAELRDERDRWRGQAERLAETGKPVVGILDRIFGRR